MTIYADQMFLENFIMNYIIIYITGRFAGCKIKWYRLSIGASIGAMYVLFSYIWGFYFNLPVWSKILLSLIIIFLSFGKVNLKTFGRLIFIFYLVTLTIGGASLGLAYLFNISIIANEGILYVEEFPIVMISAGIAVTIVTGKYIHSILKEKIKHSYLYTIDISFFDKTLTTRALMDSGHNAREPFTNFPVVIIEKNVIKDVVPESVLNEALEGRVDDLWRKRLRLIPISVIGAEKELLIGFKTDEFLIYDNGEKKYVQNVIAACCEKKLSKEDTYFALISSEFF